MKICMVQSRAATESNGQCTQALKGENMPEWMPENPYKEYIAAECVYEDWLEDDGRKNRFCNDLKRTGFNEGCQKTAHGIVEWLDEPCPRHITMTVYRHECSGCLEQLRKEVGL